MMGEGIKTYNNALTKEKLRKGRKARWIER